MEVCLRVRLALKSYQRERSVFLVKCECRNCVVGDGLNISWKHLNKIGSNEALDISK